MTVYCEQSEGDAQCTQQTAQGVYQPGIEPEQLFKQVHACLRYAARIAINHRGTVAITGKGPLLSTPDEVAHAARGPWTASGCWPIRVRDNPEWMATTREAHEKATDCLLELDAAVQGVELPRDVTVGLAVSTLFRVLLPRPLGAASVLVGWARLAWATRAMRRWQQK